MLCRHPCIAHAPRIAVGSHPPRETLEHPTIVGVPVYPALFLNLPGGGAECRVYDRFREFSVPANTGRSLFGCLPGGDQIPERFAAALALTHAEPNQLTILVNFSFSSPNKGLRGRGS